jgi:hydroxypyruvate isomerase
MSLRYSANLSILWPALPLAERFQRAAAAGFDAVELWWPGDEDAALLPQLTRESGLELVLLNFDAGDMQAGDRGLLSDPKRADQFRRNVPRALEIAAACGCRRLNALLGLEIEGLARAEQLEIARANVRWAAEQAARSGASVLIEAVNSYDNGPYLITGTDASAQFIASVSAKNVVILYDVYHMTRMDEDVLSALERHWGLVSHIQIADVPGRGQPGTGTIDFAALFDWLEARAYRGRVGLEYRPASGTAEDSFEWMAR